MDDKDTRRDGNEEVRFFGVLRESRPLHFYLLQLVGFAYFLYRFASRNYTTYGLMPEEKFSYHFPFGSELWPAHPLDLFSGQFLYAFLPRPGPDVILVMQYVIVAACVLGLLGIRPKWCAAVAFALGLHITGMLARCDAPHDGGDPALCAMLALALAPARSFYGPRNGFSLSRRGAHYHWPVFLFLFLVGSYYTCAGLNKVVDIGPHWPFELHLERWAVVAVERSVFVENRFIDPAVASSHSSAALSVAGGFVTLTGELFFITVLFLPRYRWFFVSSMIALHVLVFLVSGINFVGSSFLLLLCFDFSALADRVTVYHVGGRGFAAGLLAIVRRFDWLGRITVVPAGAGQALRAETEGGEVYTGADAVEQLFARCPLLVPLSLPFKLPSVIYLARYFVNRTTPPGKLAVPAATRRAA